MQPRAIRVVRHVGAPRLELLCRGQLARENRDENDVVDAENDLEESYDVVVSPWLASLLALLLVAVGGHFPPPKAWTEHSDGDGAPGADRVEVMDRSGP